MSSILLWITGKWHDDLAMMLDTFLTRDAALLRAFLADDPARAAYLLGDLDPAYFGSCRWFVAAARTRPVAVLLSFEAPAEPVLLSHGAPDGIAAILHTLGGELTPACWAKIPAGHGGAFESIYSIVRARELWAMELTAFRPVDAPDVVQLSQANLPEMLRLYESVTESYFDPNRMPAALYFGRYDGGRLVSVAGIHAWSPRDHIAVLGDIATDDGARNRGHAGAVTSRLIEELLRRGCTTIALHVAADNAPAISAYRRLGFVFREVLMESRCERRSITARPPS